jgi:GNAT superfamily N-acetyltransferase
MFTEAAYGRPPVADGSITVLPALGPQMHAVAAFAAHHVIAADVDEEVVRQRLPTDDLGAPMSASFLLFLAGWLGAEPGTLDVVLARTARLEEPAVAVWRRDDLNDHPRVRRARRYRPDAVVYADREQGEPDGVLVVGQGLAGRWEMAFEVAPSARGRGLGRRLAATAATIVPEGQPVFAQVAPGNPSSVRACLAAGYVAIGAEVLFVVR